MDICMMVYWGQPNNDMLETALKTFRKVSNAHLQVYSDNNDKELIDYWQREYGCEVVVLESDLIEGQRCYRKMKCVSESLDKLNEDDRLIVSDVDVYFLDDPFSAFDKCDFEIGVTRRFHPYRIPINAGLFFIRPTAQSRQLFGEGFEQYAENNPDTRDWFVDQDYLNCLWEWGYAIDVGWEYNFCPNTDIFGVKLAAGLIRRAYESRSVKVLHLKSQLKNCIYSEYMVDVVRKRPTGEWNWYQKG